MAKGLDRPWGIAFLPIGNMLVSERPGRQPIFTPDGKRFAPVTGLPAVVARGKLIEGDSPKVVNVEVLFHQTPSLKSTLHFGCWLVFADDGTPFVTLGDRSITEGRM